MHNFLEQNLCYMSHLKGLDIILNLKISFAELIKFKCLYFKILSITLSSKYIIRLIIVNASVLVINIWY